MPCLHPCLHSRPSCPQTPLHDPILDPHEARPLPVRRHLAPHRGTHTYAGSCMPIPTHSHPSPGPCSPDLVLLPLQKHPSLTPPMGSPRPAAATPPDDINAAPTVAEGAASPPCPTRTLLTLPARRSWRRRTRPSSVSLRTTAVCPPRHPPHPR